MAVSGLTAGDLGGPEAYRLRLRLRDLQHEEAGLRGKLCDASDAVEAHVGAASGLSSKLVQHAGHRSVALESAARWRHASVVEMQKELTRREQLLAQRDTEIVALRRTIEQHREDFRRTGAIQRAVVSDHFTQRAEAAALNAQNDMLFHNLSTGNVAYLERMRQNQLHMPKASEALRLSSEMNRSMKVAEGLRAGVLAEANRLTAERARLSTELSAIESRCAALRPLLAQQAIGLQQQQHAWLFETDLQSAKESDLRQRLSYERRLTENQKQRAMLNHASAFEDEQLLHEQYQALHAIRRMAPQLRAQGRSVLSIEVAGDPIDRSVHEFVRMSRAAGLRPPSVWRLSDGSYILDEDTVKCELVQGRLMVVAPGRGLCPILEYAQVRGFMLRR